MEKFFQFCGEVGDYYEITDFLLRRYGSIESVASLPVEQGHKLLTKALEMDRTEWLYQWWLCYVPNMTSKTFLPFNEFKDRLTGANIDNRPAEDILAEVEEIKRRLITDGG